MRLKQADLLRAFICVPFLALPAFAADPAPATTGTELEEVIITAERRTTDIQSVAASVSVRTGEELAAQGRYTTRQILEDIPGVAAVDNASVNVGTADIQGNNINIRGIGGGSSAGGSPAGLSPAAGAAVYVDGVYEGVGSGYDIDRVEVLRGPQGTLYGRSATSGVAAFHTRNPSTDEGFGGNAGIEFGDYDLQHYNVGVNIPLTDTLAARVSGDYYDRGKGFFNSAGRGISERTNGRAKLLWQPSDAFSLLVGVAYEKREDFTGGSSTTAVTQTLVTTTTTNPIRGGAFKHSRQFWAEANWDVGPFMVTYLPSFRSWEQNDFQFGDPNFLGCNCARLQKFLMPKDDFITHELRVASRDDAAVQWQAGVFYYHNILDNNNHNYLANTNTLVELAILSDSQDQKDTLNTGYFAETTIPLNDSLRMTLGARYDDTKVVVSEFFRDNPYALCGGVNQFRVVLPPGAVCTGPGTASVPGPPGTTISGVVLNFHNFNYKARIEYDLTPKNLLYGMISTGFRPGDVGIVAALAFPPFTPAHANVLAPEKLTSIEVGSKNRFLDDSLQVNVGAYYYNYKGFQTSYVPDTPAFDPGSINNSVPLTVPAKLYGGELELLYRLTAQDRIGLNYNYVESRWYDQPAAFKQAQPQEKRPVTPYTITANYAHEFNLPGGSTLSARIDGRFEAARMASNLHVDYLAIGYDKYVQVGSRTIGNISAAWASMGGRYSVSAYVRNFTDKVYTSYGVGGNLNQLSVNYSDPRTYGAQASVRF